MPDINLVKVADGILVAADEGTANRISKVHIGELLRGDWKKARNPLFHRKFFALLNVGYEAWEPGEIDSKWGAAQKDFERFREEVTILSGHYESVHSMDGSFRVVAKSISFASMEETEFAQFYSKVADVLLQKILTNYSREDLDEYVEQILGFV